MGTLISSGIDLHIRRETSLHCFQVNFQMNATNALKKLFIKKTSHNSQSSPRSCQHQNINQNRNYIYCSCKNLEKPNAKRFTYESLRLMLFFYYYLCFALLRFGSCHSCFAIHSIEMKSNRNDLFVYRIVAFQIVSIVCFFQSSN